MCGNSILDFGLGFLGSTQGTCTEQERRQRKEKNPSIIPLLSFLSFSSNSLLALFFFLQCRPPFSAPLIPLVLFSSAKLFYILPFFSTLVFFVQLSRHQSSRSFLLHIRLPIIFFLFHLGIHYNKPLETERNIETRDGERGEDAGNRSYFNVMLISLEPGNLYHESLARSDR